MARRDTDTGLSDYTNDTIKRIVFKSNSHEKIEVEINRDAAFVCYPYETATIDEKEINKIQEFIDKGLLIKVGN